ncbi:MAG: site-specific integrase [Desulfobacter sp.]|nr:MAG: site-specific integrase [Desulfobacter sp.]
MIEKPINSMIDHEDDILILQASVKEFQKNVSTNKDTLLAYFQIAKRIIDYNKAKRHDDYDICAYALDSLIGKNTFYKYKAALQHCLVSEIQDSLDAYKKKHIKADLDNAWRLLDKFNELAPMIGSKAKVAFWRENVSIYPDLEIRKQKEKLGKAKKKEGRQQRANSKRKSIVGLPKNWQISVCKNVKEKYHVETFLLALTGCRPKELFNGITTYMQDGHLMCRINGAKIGDNKGHEYRTLGFTPSKNPIAQLFVMLLEKNDQERITYQLPGEGNADDVRAYGDHIRYIAQRKLGLKHVSSYSFRHQFASDLRKHLGGDPGHEIDFALAMGHMTTSMRKHYGLRQCGNGNLGLTYFDAARKDEVKDDYSPPEHVREQNQADQNRRL